MEVTPIGAAERVVPTCPEGAEWDGEACVAKRVVTETECPSGSSWDGNACVIAEVQCPAGTELRDDDCVRVVEAAPAATPPPKQGKSTQSLLSEKFRARSREKSDIVDEIRSREPAFERMEKDHRLRPKAILGLAHRYVELAVRAERDATEAYYADGRDRATKTASLAHRMARKYYKMLVSEYPGVCIDGACVDEFLYEIAREYEASGDRAAAKKYYAKVDPSSSLGSLAASALARLH